MKTIGIFGAQGSFGSCLMKRLSIISSKDEIKILGTENRTNNKSIAERCDLAIICVKPNDTTLLLEEINPILHRKAQILSFVARYPLEDISQLTGRPAGRGMSDPWWNYSAFYLQSSFTQPAWLQELTKNKPLSAQCDNAIDRFTVAISYLFVALLLNNQQTNCYDSHISWVKKELGQSTESCLNPLPRGNPQELLHSICTEGGVSKHILTILKTNPNIKPQRLVDQVLS